MRENDPTPRDRLPKRISWEVLGAAAIVAFLVVLALLPRVVGGDHRGGGEGMALDQLKELRTALGCFCRLTGDYPEGLAELTSPMPDGPTVYMLEVPLDPWRREYVYRRDPAGERPYSLFSLGRDGEAGTDDDIRLDSPRREE